jgi:hypothetical protein
MLNNELTIWNNGFYYTIYVLKFILAFCFYIAVLNSSYELGQSKYYKTDVMMGYRRNNAKLG